MTIKEFNKLYLGKAVHCDTEEKANEFLALADSVGYGWGSGESLIEKNEWERYEEETCYEVTKSGIWFGSTNYFNLGTYRIIEYQPQLKFKVGDKVRVNNASPTINGKVGVIVEVNSLIPTPYYVKINGDDWTLWFYENQLEKVEELTYKEETIIAEIKTKLSEINILLNRLEKKEKGE